MDSSEATNGITSLKRLLTAGEAVKFVVYLASLLVAAALSVAAVQSKVDEIDTYGSRALIKTNDRVDALEKAQIRIEMRLETLREGQERILRLLEERP